MQTFIRGKIMEPGRFFMRVVLVILGVVTFHILGIEFLIFFVMAPTWSEFGIMLLYPLPLAGALVAAYIFITYRYTRSIRVFLRLARNNGQPATAQVQAAQDRCLNLPYFLSALSFPAYIIGGSGGIWIVRRMFVNWPAETVTYGVLAGIIAGLLTIPMSEYFTAIATRPALRIIMKFSPGLERARSAGVRVPLRMKFVLMVVVMVVGITGYAVIISYSMLDTAIGNMQKIEAMLSSHQATHLADHSLGIDDMRVKSVAYFRSRLGSLGLFFIGIMTVGLILALAVSFAAANAITRPLQIFGRVAEKIKDGQYNESIDIIANDEFAELAASFNRMTGTLLSQLQENQMLIDSIREAVETLGPMSRELVSIADQQASASVEQATATENAADTGREIAEAARQIAENANMVARGSEITQQLTQAGRERLSRTGTNLEEIAGRMQIIRDSVFQLEQQSREIDDIVETIRNISGKTNILSLNAGIEAIRAGAGGVQFGVVAREIRLLAKDSGQSAKRIRGNIERIQESVAGSLALASQGEQAVQSGRETMQQMTEQFDKIREASINAVQQLGQIENMTLRQAEANEQLSSIIFQIKESTQETSASAEQTHNALRTLKDMVVQLQAHLGGKAAGEDTARV